MEFYLTKTINGDSLEQVEEKVTNALKEQGFGIITEIDVKQTLKNKIDVEFRPYKILGACNPSFAYEALQSSDKIGVMLPCNVCIQEKSDNKYEVFSVNPLVAMESVKTPAIEKMGNEVTERLQKVLNHI